MVRVLLASSTFYVRRLLFCPARFPGAPEESLERRQRVWRVPDAGCGGGEGRHSRWWRKSMAMQEKALAEPGMPGLLPHFSLQAARAACTGRLHPALHGMACVCCLALFPSSCHLGKSLSQAQSTYEFLIAAITNCHKPEWFKSTRVYYFTRLWVRSLRPVGCKDCVIPPCGFG